MPDTSAYLVYGYIVIFGILASYILYLASKGKKVFKKLKELDRKS